MNLTTALRLNELPDAPCIALTGAGGKTSLLFRLGVELAASGRQTLLTTTTRLWARQVEQAPWAVLSADESLLASELTAALRSHGQVMALSGPDAEAGKVRGLSPETVCRLARLPDVKAAAVEADGSRERPLKAPADHEPAVPPCATHAVTVVGLSVLGQPLNATWVHRPERVARLTGLAPGKPITADAIARLSAHPEGGLRGHPAGARSLLYLNLMDRDDEETLAAARQIARAVLRTPANRGQRYQSALIGHARADAPVSEAHGRVCAVVLAAGRGSRMQADRPKQLLPWGEGSTLVGHAASVALAAPSVDETLVVAGYQAAAVEEALAGLPARVVANPAWSEGQSGSVRAALAALPADVSAVLFLLADQPAVTSQTIDALAAAHRRSLAPAVAPVYRGGQRGNPVLFDRATFAELAAVSGDAGGRTLLQRLGDRMQLVPIDLPQPEGVETWEDYRRLQPGAQVGPADVS